MLHCCIAWVENFIAILPSFFPPSYISFYYTFTTRISSQLCVDLLLVNYSIKENDPREFVWKSWFEWHRIWRWRTCTRRQHICRYLDQTHQLYYDFEIWIHILQSFMPLNYFNKIELKQTWDMFKKSYMFQVDEVLKHIVKELFKTNNGKKNTSKHLHQSL